MLKIRNVWIFVIAGILTGCKHAPPDPVQGREQISYYPSEKGKLVKAPIETDYALYQWPNKAEQAANPSAGKLIAKRTIPQGSSLGFVQVSEGELQGVAGSEWIPLPAGFTYIWYCRTETGAGSTFYNDAVKERLQTAAKVALVVGVVVLVALAVIHGHGGGGGAAVVGHAAHALPSTNAAGTSIAHADHALAPTPGLSTPNTSPGPSIGIGISIDGNANNREDKKADNGEIK